MNCALIQAIQPKMPPPPQDRPDDTFYLKPLSKCTGDVWFHPVSHNVLGGVMKRLRESAGLQGHYTNSLCATAATWLFEARAVDYAVHRTLNHCRCVIL